MMKKVVTCCAAALLLVAGLPRQGFAQAKIKVAIWQFENHAETSWWFYRDMGPAARNQIDTEFSENKLLSNKFAIIERDKLDLVLKEQGLGQSGAVDPASAAKVGKILGVKYIVLGGIDKFNIDKTGGAIGKFGVGGHLVQANATINMRLIDTTTAERVISLQGDANVKKGGGFMQGNSLSHDSEWGLANETIQKAAKAVVEKFVTGDYLARVSTASNPTGTVEGKIIRVDGTRAYINLGAEAGIKVGDKFAVFNIGEALVDPDTGAKLGADEKRTGDGSVVEVQPKFAVINFTGKAAAKDTVRKQ
jgi:curli biogenesis system outer membrane secretion channel CsgG